MNFDDAVLVCSGIELLGDRGLRAARRGKDVEVGQNQVAVDGDVEIALARSGVGPFHKVQPNVITRERIQTGDGPCRCSPAFRVVYREGCRIRDLRGVDWGKTGRRRDVEVVVCAAAKNKRGRREGGGLEFIYVPTA